MITNDHKTEYYQALLAKNSEYEGIFYVGVKTTGVFCRPTCPARKPKFEHCEFFETAQEAGNRARGFPFVLNVGPRKSISLTSLGIIGFLPGARILCRVFMAWI